MTPERQQVDFWSTVENLFQRMTHGGVLCTVADGTGETNVLTLGWGLTGPFYHGHPNFGIAVTPLRHSWKLLEQGDDFCICVPDDTIQEAVALCGKASGRDMDKFEAAGLTPVRGQMIQAPAIRECPINIECRIYERVHPPHRLLTPEHRQRPVAEQHTIYFAEVLSCYGWKR